MLWVFDVVHVSRTSPTERKKGKQENMRIAYDAAAQRCSEYPNWQVSMYICSPTCQNQNSNAFRRHWTLHRAPRFLIHQLGLGFGDVFSEGFINSSAWHLSFLQTIPKTQMFPYTRGYAAVCFFYSVVKEGLHMCYMLQRTKIQLFKTCFESLFLVTCLVRQFDFCKSLRSWEKSSSSEASLPKRWQDVTSHLGENDVFILPGTPKQTNAPWASFGVKLCDLTLWDLKLEVVFHAHQTSRHKSGWPTNC